MADYINLSPDSRPIGQNGLAFQQYNQADYDNTGYNLNSSRRQTNGDLEGQERLLDDYVDQPPDQQHLSRTEQIAEQQRRVAELAADGEEYSNFEANKKVIQQNREKLNIGFVEILYFGFFIFEPSIFPNSMTKLDSCRMPFTQITAVYVGLLLLVMVPLRVTLNCFKNHSPNRVNKIYAGVVVIHMFVCLGWLIYACIELQYSSEECWDELTWQYLNYYALLLITMGPACTLGLGLALFILCSPCIAQQMWTMLRDERTREEMGDRVIKGLAQREFNTEQFTAQKECAICLCEFEPGQPVTPLSCDVKHYFHTGCIEQWIKTKNQCPLCRTEIKQQDLTEFNKDLDRRLNVEAEQNLLNLTPERIDEPLT